MVELLAFTYKFNDQEKLTNKSPNNSLPSLNFHFTSSQTFESHVSLMASLVAFHPGSPLVMEAVSSLTTPEEAFLRVLEVAELVNEDVSADVTLDRSSMHLGDVSFKEPDTSEPKGSTEMTLN